MCGIAGVISFSKYNAQEIRHIGSTFSQQLAHRGPDDEGYICFVDGPAITLHGPHTDAHCCDQNPTRSIETFIAESHGLMLHRRLSILGLSARGHQPMRSNCGRYWISLNGEIYNYKELADEFKLGNSSQTDTEILLELWKLKGPDCLSRLDGFFAFSLWDDECKQLYLVRDRLGVKPLYYACNKDAFWFASEDYALSYTMQQHGLKEYGVDALAVQLHLEFGKSDKISLFHGIQELPKGSYLCFTSHNWKIPVESSLVVWYNPLRDHTTQKQQQAPLAGEKETTIEKFVKPDPSILRTQLLDSITRRLRSDVPIGFAVSGGIDSAALLAFAKLILPKGTEFHVFSINAPGSEGDESMWQKMVVNSLGGIWHPIDISMETSDLLLKYTMKTHRPAVAWNNLAHFVLCEAVQKTGIKVLFNGQGADELFAGYPHYYTASFWKERKSLWKHRHKWPISFSSAAKQWIKKTVGSFLGRIFQTDLQVLMHDDYYGDCLGQLLRYEDRNSMSCGIESRNPFADDHMLAETWLNNEPLEFNNNKKSSLSDRLNNGYSKGVLRAALKGDQDLESDNWKNSLLPKALILRTDKKGFTVPAHSLTLRCLEDWKPYILSTQLDDFVAISLRKKVLKQAKDTQTLFRWASMGCFLEALIGKGLPNEK